MTRCDSLASWTQKTNRQTDFNTFENTLYLSLKKRLVNKGKSGNCCRLDPLGGRLSGEGLQCDSQACSWDPRLWKGQGRQALRKDWSCGQRPRQPRPVLQGDGGRARPFRAVLSQRQGSLSASRTNPTLQTGCPEKGWGGSEGAWQPRRGWHSLGSCDRKPFNP